MYLLNKDIQWIFVEYDCKLSNLFVAIIQKPYFLFHVYLWIELPIEQTLVHSRMPFQIFRYA